MASFKSIHDGLEIMMKYADPDDQIGGANHDIIFFVDKNTYAEFSDEDNQRLDKLGFHVDKEGGLSLFV